MLWGYIMINKKLLLLAIFLMSMVAISAASAAENSTDEKTEIRPAEIHNPAGKEETAQPRAGSPFQSPSCFFHHRICFLTSAGAVEPKLFIARTAPAASR